MSLVFAGAVEAISALNKKKQEGFVVSEEESSRTFMGNFMHVLNMLVSVFAFYLAGKCVMKGKNPFVHILGACCCGLFYIAYALAIGCM
tara:strand:- start:1450 stop:1716 length:267 start_codon:yes stop_codon:yes gene_type:complete